MILVDTSIIVAWLDRMHPDHLACTRSLERWAEKETLAVSSVTFAELAVGARTREAVEEDLKGFDRVDLDFDSAWRAGLAYRRYQPIAGSDQPVLPDFLIRGQAASLGCRHLTNDHRRTKAWPDIDFIYPDC